VIVVQRVRVRWSAAGRGAPQADVRRGLNRPVTLPESLPTADVVVHEVLADEAVGYARRDEGLAGGVEQARDLGLWLTLTGSAVGVDRLPGRAAYPRPGTSTHLFTLARGQVGRYRANFRFTGCMCSPSWFYEDWLIHVSNGTVARDHFVQAEPDRDIDNRVHLYGGPGRRTIHHHRYAERDGPQAESPARRPSATRPRVGRRPVPGWTGHARSERSGVAGRWRRSSSAGPVVANSPRRAARNMPSNMLVWSAGTPRPVSARAAAGNVRRSRRAR